MTLQNTPEMLLLNELDDVAAGIFADHQGDMQTVLKASDAEEKEARAHIQKGPSHPSGHMEMR